MANGPVRGKSWGGRHGRLPSTDWPLECRSERRIPVDREAPGRQERTERHQGGRKGLIGQRAKHQGGRKGSNGQPARHQGGRKDSLRGTREAEMINWTICEAPGRHQEAGKLCSSPS